MSRELAWRKSIVTAINHVIELKTVQQWEIRLFQQVSYSNHLLSWEKKLNYELFLIEGVMKWMLVVCRIGGGGKIWRNLQGQVIINRVIEHF